jgi:asparagine synthase (glutamine-hydrolysing)
MCGICGTLSRRGLPDAAHVGAMTRRLAHRGPDGEGVRTEGPAVLGHRRLSIIDLSEAAAEPMSNEDGSLWLVFNGEIYNFRELRRELEPRHRFKSRTDAEVLIHLYEERGDDAVAALEGMFAFALWDAGRQRLLLARDRAGKKPLYYHDGPGLFAFASEVKGLLAHPQVPRERDPAAVALYLSYGYVPCPRTLYHGIRSLPPAHRMVVTQATTGEPTAYWRASFRDGEPCDEAEAAQRLRESLRAAVARRLVADVPVGAFLSGGIDSSAVVALMAEQAAGRVRTFSIGFAGAPAYDETAQARAVASRFGTEHTEFVVEPRALELLDRLVFFHDGPFADSSAIPTFLLSELTRKSVTVALSGDGGDEVFAGYRRFLAAVLAEKLPVLARRGMAGVAGLLPEPEDRRSPVRLVKRFLESGASPLAERYLRWTAVFPEGPAAYLRGELVAAASYESLLAPVRQRLDAPGSVLSRLLSLNFETYLPDDLMVKVDRMSMAHGLEVRSPFLDTSVVELGAALPDRLRLRFGRGKRLLRSALRDLLPAAVLDRGKAGFGVPLGAWLRQGAEGFLQDRLLEPGSPIREYLEPQPVAELVRSHLSRERDASHEIWALLTLESWLRQERSR